MLKLVVYASHEARRHDLGRGEWVAGSDPACALLLPYSGVSKRHARLSWDGEAVWIEDLGGRQGIAVNGRRVRRARLSLLDEVRIGSATLVVEEIGASDPRVVAAQSPAPLDLASATGATAEALHHHLARLAHWVLAETPSRGTAEELLGDLLRGFGGGALFLLRVDLEAPAVRLAAVTEPAWLAHGEALLAQLPAPLPAAPRSGGSVSAVDGDLFGTLGSEPSWIVYRYFPGLDRVHLLVVALPNFAGATWCTAGLAVLANLLVLGLVHHVGRYESLLPGNSARNGLRLAPGVAIGESAAITALLQSLSALAGSPHHVVLRGEAGTGKEAWAESLHLSSPRAGGPFVRASCAGSSEGQLAVELFGASIPGRGTVLERSGKLLMADGGTLFLDDIDEMPAGVQGRLVRTLREGWIDGTTGHSASPGPQGSRGQPIDVRIVAGCRERLDRLAARDRFRVDLAHTLSRFVVDVPPLRERRNEIPILVQSVINRLSQETGKRIQGITVEALACLSRYPYPGNWPELENIVRQMVYLCPPGQPVPRSLLPERLRATEWVDLSAHHQRHSDLSLDSLVAVAEEGAIREALRRTAGNKSSAALLLGLSRNGLAMKMERLGIEGKRR